MVVETEIPVRYSETDGMGIVYHANYLVYFEVGRTAFLEAIGFPYTEIEAAGYMAPVVEVNLKYGAPLRYGDVALVRTRITKLSPVKVTYTSEVFRKGQNVETEKPCCVGDALITLVDSENFHPVSTKRAFPALYAKYQEVLEPAQ